MSRPFALLFACAMTFGCSHSPAPKSEQTPQVLLAPKDAPSVTVKVELARTDAERARGLMFRQQLVPGWGMLFLFERAQPQTFWMRNTYVPLDMIFITSERRVLGTIHQVPPLNDEPRSIPGASQYVLEVPAGFAQTNHIGPGTPVTFINIE